MTKSDLIFMSGRSLWRRKLRSSLTILGVIIGTASIVLMISLALAMNQNYENQMNQWGALTLLEVTEEDSIEDMVEVEALDEEALAYFETLSHVEKVIPYISTTMNVTVGDYISMREVTIVGLDSDELEALGYIPIQGRSYTEDEQAVAIVGGSFTNQLVKRGQQVGSSSKSSSNKNGFSGMPNMGGSMRGNNSGGNMPGDGGSGMPSGNMMPNMGSILGGDIPNGQNRMRDTTSSEDGPDVFSDVVKLTYQTFNFRTTNNSLQGGFSTASSSNTPKATTIEIVGVLESGNSNTDNYIFMPREEVLSLIRQKAIYEAKLSGESPNTTIDTYDKVTLKVSSSDAVTQVQSFVEFAGFLTSSAQDTLEEMQNMSASIQLILMGIGAISLIVSAIGITNTMMMSISERTKEIGVMKVIGAVISDIKQMFLVEAAMIGFLGGVLGVALCLLISWLLNTYAVGFFGDLVGASSSYQTYVSLIPPYLSGAAIVFATLIGLIAGYLPAKRATALSALTALRAD